MMPVPPPRTSPCAAKLPRSGRHGTGMLRSKRLRTRQHRCRPSSTKRTKSNAAASHSHTPDVTETVDGAKDGDPFREWYFKTCTERGATLEVDSGYYRWFAGLNDG